MTIVTLGIDIAKHVFQLHGVDKTGTVVVRKQLPRKRLLDYLSNLEPCLVGIEACGGVAVGQLSTISTSKCKPRDEWRYR